jgi:MYXO-CTERM domain-containing protein
MRREFVGSGLVGVGSVIAALGVAALGSLAYGCGQISAGTCADNGTCIATDAGDSSVAPPDAIVVTGDVVADATLPGDGGDGAESAESGDDGGNDAEAATDASDASDASDAAADAPADRGSSPSSSGCGCTTAGVGGGWAGGWLALLAVGIGVVRLTRRDGKGHTGARTGSRSCSDTAGP